MSKLRLNHQITSNEVRIVQGPGAGTVVTHNQAMILANEYDLDLIEISPGICIIEELGKWKYEQAKKLKGSKQFVAETKQIQIRAVTEAHDLEHKTRQAKGFLEEGHRVRIVVKFHGRELAHPDEGNEALDRMIEALDCKVDSRTGLEGKQIIANVSRKS
jgi:translation initiation factor IF-3